MSATCCGLARNHADRCAFFCSGCIGGGMDLDNDGAGVCPDCEGAGWFDNDGNPVWLTQAEYDAIEAQCAAADRGAEKP